MIISKEALRILDPVRFLSPEESRAIVEEGKERNIKLREGAGNMAPEELTALNDLVMRQEAALDVNCCTG